MLQSKASSVLIAASFAFLLIVQAVSAADLIDETKQLVCAATEVAGCEEAGTCIQGPATAFNLPVLLRISMKDMAIESTREGGERRNSPVARAEAKDDELVLQGAESGATWIATIHWQSGRMTVTVAREGEAYVIFGACTPM